MNERILLVDDSRLARKIAMRALQNGGFDNVVEAVDAKSAMEVFQAENVDLVLLDITLPDNFDLTLLRQMLEKKPKAKIIMISAIGQELIINDAISMGARGFVVKPYEEKEFLQMIFKVLETE